METKSRTLEITILSAEDLTINNKPIKKNTSVVVSIGSFDNKETKMDAKGGNDKLVMEMPLEARFVTLHVKCKDKSVGSVRIPVTDLIGGYSAATCLQFLSYRLRDPKGLKNGIVNVCVRVKEAAGAIGLGVLPIGGRNDFGVVTGIPIWTAYPSNYLFR